MTSVRGNLKNIWKDFLAETSLHGCKKTVDNADHVIKRGIWILFFSGMFVTFAYTVVTLYITYEEYNFTTKTSATFHEELQMPAITICNLHAFDKHRFDHSNALLYEYLQYAYDNNSPFDVNDPKWTNYSISVDDLDQAGFQIRDLINVATIYNEDADLLPLFSITYPDRFVKCFTLNGYWDKPADPFENYMQDESLRFHLFINVNQDRYAFPSLTTGIRIFAHPPSEPVDMLSPSSVLSPGQAYEIRLILKHYEYLPHPYNSYQHSDCIDLSRRQLKYVYKYSYTACMKECLTEVILDMCGCAVEFVFYNASSKFCTVPERVKCVDPIYHNYAKGYLTCNCTRSCFEVEYGHEVSSGMYPAASYMDTLIAMHAAENITQARNNLMHLYVKMKNMMILTTSHEKELTFTDIIGQLGGYMGFCLGASLLTLIELLEVLVRCIKTILCRPSSKVHEQDISKESFTEETTDNISEIKLGNSIETPDN